MVKRLFFILLLVTSSAFADAPTIMYAPDNYTPTTWFSTREELCQFLYIKVPPSGNYTAYKVSGNTCITVPGGYLGGGMLVQNRCAGGTAPDTTKPLEQQCSSPPPPTCKAGNTQNYVVVAENLPASVCKDLCSWTQTGSTSVSVNGSWLSEYTSTASNCATNTPLLSPEPKECPKGTHNASNDATNLDCKVDDPKSPSCWAGSTNISTDPTIAICVDNSPPPAEEPEPDGAPIKTTDTTIQKNSDGSTTTTTTETTKQKFTDGTTTVTSTTTQTTTKADGTTVTKVTQGGSQSPSSGGGGGGGFDGSPAGLGGDLYTKKDKTFESVFQTFRDTVNQAPFVAGATGFLAVDVGGGACPSWTASVEYLNLTVDVGKYFCAGTVSQMLNIVRIGLLIGAAYIAFRIAFL